jgi:hypothetical protein
MANQSRTQQCQPCEEKGFGVLLMAVGDRQAIEAPPIANNLWRQIDRWVNEGGAVGDGTTQSEP